MEYIAAVIVAIFGSTGFWQLVSTRKASNKDIMAAVKTVAEKEEALEKKVDGIKGDLDRTTAETARVRVLRFNGEILRNDKHTAEEFDQVLADIDTYERYCEENPQYPNNKAILAIKNVKRVYENCLQQHDFL